MTGTPDDSRSFVTIANALGRATRPGELPARLTSAARDLRLFFDAAACSIALAAADGDTLRFVAADGVGGDTILGVELPVTRGIAGWVAMAGQSILVSDVSTDPRFARDVAESTSYVPRTIMAAPLLAGDEDVLGVIEVLDAAAALDSATALALLGVVGREVAAIVELSARFDRLGAALLRPHLAPDDDAVTLDTEDAELGRLVGLVGELVALDPNARQLAEHILTAVRAYTTARP